MKSDYIRTLYRFSLICGALPMTGAAFILLGIYLTRAGELEGAGFAWMFFGLLCVAFGLGALFWALVADRRFGILSKRAGWLSALLLLSNFPAAYGALHAASHLLGLGILGDFTVAVRNDSRAPLKMAHIGGACCDIALGDIPPREIRQATFDIDNDGGLWLEYRQGGKTLHIIRLKVSSASMREDTGWLSLIRMGQLMWPCPLLRSKRYEPNAG